MKYKSFYIIAFLLIVYVCDVQGSGDKKTEAAKQGKKVQLDIEQRSEGDGYRSIVYQDGTRFVGMVKDGKPKTGTLISRDGSTTNVFNEDADNVRGSQRNVRGSQRNVRGSQQNTNSEAARFGIIQMGNGKTFVGMVKKGKPKTGNLIFKSPDGKKTFLGTYIEGEFIPHQSV